MIFAAAVLTLGLLAMLGLSQLYRAPEVAEPPAPVLRSAAIRVEPTDFPTTLRAYGTARSRVRLEVRPEVGGRVESLHPRLEVGLVVPEGDILFTIEKADYESRLAEAEAEAMRLRAEVERLVREEENDQRRMRVATEQRNLAASEYERIASLVREGGAESQSRLDQARASLLLREDAVVALENSLALYGSRRLAADAQLRTAMARQTNAQRDLERTEVRVGFDARVSMKDIEVGKYIVPGQTVLTVADDSLIEIPVSLESAEVSRWLDVAIDPRDAHWFGTFEDYPVTIRWAEQLDGIAHTGTLERVESYNPDTRTFALVVHVDPPKPRGLGTNAPIFPLTDGMFCHLEIPGRVAHDVYVIPREAVDSRGQVLVVRDERLVSLPVEVIRKQDNVALIASGLQPGEVVIISRPPSTLDGTKVEPLLVPFEVQGGSAL